MGERSVQNGRESGRSIKAIAAVRSLRRNFNRTPRIVLCLAAENNRKRKNAPAFSISPSENAPSPSPLPPLRRADRAAGKSSCQLSADLSRSYCGCGEDGS